MATSRPRSVQDSYHFTVVYDGCLSGDDKTDSIKLSYEFVEKLKEKARKQGINCFLPHLMIKEGQMELRELNSAVQNSKHVILVMTEGYLEKMCGKKLPDSQNDPDSMLQYIHYTIIDYKISDNADGVIVVPIYLQTRKKEISLGAYRSIQFRKKEDWKDEENWEKIWNLIPKDLQPTVLTGSAVSSPGSSVPDSGKSAQNDSNQGVRSQEPAAAAAVNETATETAENPQESMQFESLTSDARVSAEETAGSSTADSKTDARQGSVSTEDDSRGSRDHHPGSPPCVNMDSSPSGAGGLQPSALTGSAVSSGGSSEPDARESGLGASVLTGSAVSSQGSSEPDAGESAQNDSNQGVRSQEPTAPAVSETATETAENPQESMQFESLTSDARLSAETGSSTADSKTDAVSSPGSSEPDAGESGLEASAVLTGSAVSSQGSSEPDAGESAQSGVISQEIAAAVSETATDAVPSMTENFSKVSSSETTENPQDSKQVESLILDARVSAEAGSSTADGKTEAHQRSESTEDDSTASGDHNAGSTPCVNMDSSPSGARRTKSSDEKTENEGAASGISRSQSEPACSQQQQEKKPIGKKIRDWFSEKLSWKP